jgi:putative radical SAM enzyme (TIGR03279 family)
LRDGKNHTVRIKKQEYDDIGLDFETPLMDKKHSCENKCIFCFIDQLPKGLRSSLYFKDDDSRLSFLHGNYVTLTNLKPHDIQRIIDMHISPVNVSVHTTNPELRVKMMHNKRAGEVLSYLRTLADANISLCCQIVLCRGVNDGRELDYTMRRLAALAPAIDSVSVVPAGMTAYREGLYPLTPFTKEECRAVIEQVNRFGDACLAELGYRMFCVADEFYLKAELPLPEESYYGDYEQIENGVGMLRSLMAEFALELDYLYDLVGDADTLPPRHVSLATGKAAAPTIRYLASLLEKRLNGIKISVYEIENRFFGKEITVAGLLTGKDMAEQLKGKPLGDELLIPASTLRAEGDLFLCGMTPQELSLTLGVPVTPIKGDGAALLTAFVGK